MRSPSTPRAMSRSPFVAARLKFRGSAFGVGFAVRADTPALLEEARPRMPPTWRLGRQGTPRREYTLTHAEGGVRVEADGSALGHALSHRGALDVLESDLQLFVAQYSREFVFVHAGVVGLGRKALVLPGPSGAGKTTLVRALLKAGATYYSDEYALLDTSGRVHPYPRALSVRSPDGEKTRVPIGRALAATGKVPLPIGIVALTEYCAGGRWRPRPLSRGELVLMLLTNTVPARERPAEVMATLVSAVAQAEGFRSVRGSAAGVAKAIMRLADAGPRSARLLTHVRPTRLRARAPSPRRRFPASRR
jgi:hypothetical protein